MEKFFQDIELTQHGTSEDKITEADIREGAGEAQILAARKFVKPEELNAIEKAASDLLHELRRPPGTVDGRPLTPLGPR